METTIGNYITSENFDLGQNSVIDIILALTVVRWGCILTFS